MTEVLSQNSKITLSCLKSIYMQTAICYVKDLVFFAFKMNKKQKVLHDEDRSTTE